jgi:FkbM family methyltransferase
MRFKFNKEIEYYFKKFFISEKYLLKKRLIRAYKKKYEEELLYLDKIVDKASESVDVGVYRGVYTFQLSKISKHVHSFEPNPLIFPFLNKNLQKLIKNLTLYNVALSDENGETELRIPIRNKYANEDNYEEMYESGRATIHKNNIINSEYNSFKVRRVKLDDILINNPIGFVKIDAEGHEKVILLGAKEIIKKEDQIYLLKLKSDIPVKKLKTQLNLLII